MLLVTTFLMALTCCGFSKKTKEYDLYHLLEDELSVEGDIFSPKKIAFFSTTTELFEATGLDENSILSSEESDGHQSVVVNNKVKIADLTNEMVIIYRFYDDKLVAVNYSILMEETEKDKVCEILYDQFVKMQLAEKERMSIEDMKKGNKDYRWSDEKQNTIALSFPEVADGEPEIALFAINPSRDAMKEALYK